MTMTSPALLVEGDPHDLSLVESVNPPGWPNPTPSPMARQHPSSPDHEWSTLAADRAHGKPKVRIDRKVDSAQRTAACRTGIANTP